MALLDVRKHQGEECLLHLLGEGCVEAEILEIMIVHVFVTISSSHLFSEGGVALPHSVHVYLDGQMPLHDRVLAPYNFRVKAFRCTYLGWACRNPMRGPRRSIALGLQR